MDVTIPPTAYPALAKPMQRRMAHRLETLKAYVARRSEPTHTTEASRDISALYMVYDRWRSAHEVDDPGLKQVIDRCATEASFAFRAGTVEVLGLCADCCDCKDTTAEREGHDGRPDRHYYGVVL